MCRSTDEILDVQAAWKQVMIEKGWLQSLSMRSPARDHEPHFLGVSLGSWAYWSGWAAVALTAAGAGSAIYSHEARRAVFPAVRSAHRPPIPMLIGGPISSRSQRITASWGIGGNAGRLNIQLA